MAARKMSRISAQEMSALDAKLYAQFSRFCDGADGDSMTSSGMLRFVRETKLAVNMGITASEASLAFSGVVLAKKKEIRYERFQEACRKLATQKSLPFQALVQLASGEDVQVDDVAADEVEAVA